MTTGKEYYLARSPSGTLTEVNGIPERNHPCYSDISSANKVSTSRRANSRACAEARRTAHALSSAIADEDGMDLLDVEEDEEEEDEEDEDTDHGEDDEMEMLWGQEEYWYRGKYQRLSVYNKMTQCVAQVGFYDVASPDHFSLVYPATYHGVARSLYPVIYTVATAENAYTPFKLELEYMQSKREEYVQANGVAIFEDDLFDWIASRLSLVVLKHSCSDESSTLFAELYTWDGDTIQGEVDLTGTFKEL